MKDVYNRRSAERAVSQSFWSLACGVVDYRIEKFVLYEPLTTVKKVRRSTDIYRHVVSIKVVPDRIFLSSSFSLSLLHTHALDIDIW